MKIGLIVTVYNRVRYLENVLKMIAHQTLVPYEVIIADDGSVENVKGLLENYKNELKCKIKHVYQEDKGFRKSRSCNNAVIESESDYLIFIDQDLVFPESMLDVFRKNIKRKYFTMLRVYWSSSDEAEHIQQCIDVKGGYCLPRTADNFFNRLDVQKNIIKDRYNNMRFSCRLRDRGAGLQGIGFGLFKNDYLRVNGYDEAYEGWGGEDADLGLRLYYSGLSSCSITTNPIPIHLHHPLDPTKNSTRKNNLSLYKEKKINVVAGGYICHYGILNRKDDDEYSVSKIS